MKVNPIWGFKKRLYIMKNGLLCTNGKQTEVVRWDEIEELFWWRKRGISYLCRKDGSRFDKIEEMDRPQEVSAIVASAVTERLFPGIENMLAQYQKAGEVRFGQLFVTKEGIANFSRVASWEVAPVIPWAEIEAMAFKKGKIGIKVSNKWRY